MITGGCLCGAIKYEISSPLRFARNCHCSKCRKATGAAFATWAYVEVSNFRWVQGEEQLGRYQSSPEITRTFCQVCGSTMQYIAKQVFQDAFGLALGTVDGDPGCKPMRHVMVGSKAAWFEITDHLPQSEEAAKVHGVSSNIPTNPVTLDRWQDHSDWNFQVPFITSPRAGIVGKIFS